MYKAAVIGDYDSIYGFAALGLDVWPVKDDPSETAHLFRRLCEDSYAVIYITEALAETLESEIARYRTVPLPAIIPIPGVSGNTGLGLRHVKRWVEQAVGSDIIFNDKNG